MEQKDPRVVVRDALRAVSDAVDAQFNYDCVFSNLKDTVDAVHHLQDAAGFYKIGAYNRRRIDGLTNELGVDFTNDTRALDECKRRMPDYAPKYIPKEQRERFWR